MFHIYLKILLVAATTASMVYLLTPFRSLQQAAILHTIQALLPWTTAGLLLADRGARFEGGKKSRYLFAAALILLGFGDAFYFVCFYFLELDGTQGYMQLLANLPYHAVYMLAALGLLLRQADPKASLRNPKLRLALLLTFVLAVPFLIVPTWLNHSQKGLLMPMAISASAFVCSLSLLSFALYSFFSSRSLDSALLACGWFAFGVTDWAVQIEAMKQEGMGTSFNSFLWTLSGIITCLPLISRRSVIEVAPPFAEDSLAAKMRVRLLLALLVPLLFLALTLGNTFFGVLSLSFGLVFGSVAITFAIQFVLEAVNDVSRVLASMNLSSRPQETIDLEGVPGELRGVLSEAMKRAREHEQRLQAIKNAALEERRRLVEQVAHDVRSPLAALEMISGSLQELPEEKRVIVRSAVGRIKDIASNLLQELRPRSEPAASEGRAPRLTLQLLSTLIDEIIAEKRFQYRSRLGVAIEFSCGRPGYGLFSRVDLVETKRMISNLINNSVEAIDGAGSVKIELSQKDGKIELVVRDDGKGIPPEILPSLTLRGKSYGKQDGSGLGLSHARETAEGCGGAIRIESDGRNGTKVVVTLPCASAPDWFVSEVALEKGGTVVVVDDDSSIHRIWEGRLSSAGAGQGRIQTLHFSAPTELENWLRYNEAISRDATFLVDYEFLGSALTGLDLIESLGIQSRSILVTSRFEEPRIRERCEALGLKLVPKAMAGFVPISIAEPRPRRAGLTTCDAVLVDDDPLVRLTWKSVADRQGKALRAYDTVEAFLAESGSIDPRTPVYIDHELSGCRKGAEESKRLHELGFELVYLSTGHEPEKFAGIGHLAGVVGKQPPWTTE